MSSGLCGGGVTSAQGSWIPLHLCRWTLPHHHSPEARRSVDSSGLIAEIGKASGAIKLSSSFEGLEVSNGAGLINPCEESRSDRLVV
jgi:hypothetical protein